MNNSPNKTNRPDFLYTTDIEKSAGLPEGQLMSEQYYNGPSFAQDCSAALEIIEDTIVSMSNMPSPTMRGSAVLLSQLGQALKDTVKVRHSIKSGVGTLAVSATTFYAHPQFVIANAVRTDGTRLINTGLIHEAMHYSDGDALVSIDLANKYKYDIEDGSISARAMHQLANCALDVSHDSSLAEACKRDHSLSQYCDGPLLSGHADSIAEGLVKSFEKSGMTPTDTPGLAADLDLWTRRTKAGRVTKLESCTQLIDFIKRLPDPDPDNFPGNVHVIGDPGGPGTDDEDQPVDGNGNPLPPEAADAMRAAAEEQMQTNVQKAVQIAGDTGALSLLKIRFKPLRKPVRWTELLSNLSTNAAKGSKPSIKHPYIPELHRGVILPTKRATHTDAVLVFDVSGSMLGDEPPLGKFLSEIRQALVSSVKTIHIVPFDDKVHPTLTYTASSADDLRDFETPGGGGTRIAPALQAVKDRNLLAGTNLMIIITDLYLHSLPTPAELPISSHQIVWLVPPGCQGEYRASIKNRPDRYGSVFTVD